MKKETTHTESDTLHGHANKTNKQNFSDPNQLVQYLEVERTPFTIIKQTLEKGEEWFVAMGAFRLTEALKTHEEAIEAAKDESWFRIMQVVRIMIDDTMQQLKQGTYKTILEEANENKNAHRTLDNNEN